MIDKIVYYNHFHNGDVFLSKEYIKELILLFPNMKHIYYHENSSKLLKDLNIQTLSIKDVDFPQKNQIFVKDNTIYINTWIVAADFHLNGCNFISYSSMWSYIYEKINDILKTNILIKDEYFYIPETDYSFYDIPSDFSIDYDNTILFSNGNVNSGQAYRQDTEHIVHSLLNNFKDKTIILTHKTSINNDNIKYTDDIIKTIDGDLNEISWIAERCKHIIGRNSGPFIFMHTKNILNDKNKNIISFGGHSYDAPMHKSKTKSNYIFFDDKDPDLLTNNIISFIKNEEILVEKFE
jgi:hypothetical protein